MGRPHVVILGAGASRAAFQDGDANGRRLPLMEDLIHVVGLADELSRLGVERPGSNFEAVYSALHARGRHEPVLTQLETRIREYFSALTLPASPTLYDHLVLSLRQKDVIATFNWDPFLYLACARNHTLVSLPSIAYLHGSAAVGYCMKDRKKGAVGTPCPACGNLFMPAQLLFPIEKNYSADPAIDAEWRGLRAALNSAYMLTIFGYSAPQSDVEAIRLMRQAWGRSEERDLEEVEIIDIKPGDELRRTWDAFIHTHHYSTVTSFYDSWIAQHPRRTCEAMWRQTMETEFLDANPIPREAGFQDLWEWYRPLVQAEKAAK
jgi:hypothetical protein